MTIVHSSLIFLKLGGSLITDKHTPSTALSDRIQQLAGEIAAVRAEHPEIKLLLGHGSGSFGHMVARKYGTRQGVATPREWHGFTEVWQQASALNRVVVKALHDAGLPAIGFPAASSALVDDGQILEWELSPLRRALGNGLLPVVHGDVSFDQSRGGTILSTEDLFQYLARQLQPGRILLAGIEPGVWADYPTCTRVVPEITPSNQADILQGVRGSGATDVTGGMASKVQQMLALISDVPSLQVTIFSAVNSGELRNAILEIDSADQLPGTLIHKPI